ncbi:MAG: hypothetical protein ABSA12_08700 [Verrucomicrobiia bacterium]
MRKRSMLLIALGVLLAALFVFRPAISARRRILRLRKGVRETEEVCLSLSNSLAAAQANADWNRLQWYYAFREVEVDDAGAWQSASRKVDDELASLSNSMRVATDRLARRRAELALRERREFEE